MDAIGFDAHNHSACIATGVAQAEAYCAERKLQFTPVRRRVLEILLKEHRAMGAYDLLPILAAEGLGSQPPVAYRALDFLLQNGFCHKIERLNAFIACVHPDRKHAPAFLICRNCDSVAEAHTDLAGSPLAEAASAAGFTIERTVVEAEGICPSCAEEPA
ncbi:transcriptional repressor [Alphaproteobacteria bacterium KMM 3653]|uniref:Transcriptional repressor n=1 Tax=Harenicola maris TaxID=2841044 RepID=A0AAP2CKH2_9RHOB|nr:transcriptional repressor [Harenicola maris]